MSVMMVLILLPSTSIVQSSANEEVSFLKSLEYALMVVYCSNFNLTKASNEYYTLTVLSILFVFLIVFVIKLTIAHSMVRYWIRTQPQEKNEELIIENFVQKYYLNSDPS